MTPPQSRARRGGEREPLIHHSNVGWRCEPCGWTTFSLDDMHRFVNWPNPDNSISLVCPRCGSEGRFIDAYRGDNAMPTFRKKPVEIEARRLPVYGPASEPGQHEIAEELADWCGGIVIGDVESPALAITIPTLEGDHLAKPGDWIIRGVQGEFYPCKPDIFEATYEPV